MLKVFRLIYVIKNINIYILLEKQIDKKTHSKKQKNKKNINNVRKKKVE